VEDLIDCLCLTCLQEFTLIDFIHIPCVSQTITEECFLFDRNVQGKKTIKCSLKVDNVQMVERYHLSTFLASREGYAERDINT
jgi:hypothetical protein